ncbi:APC family permease [Agromyces marinus]|uniref:Amino acid transporter n=1 Tax=Agromyces marinus TaxID=1389020 RepID=A0ABN6YAT0_9MICO|nr:APC family permease [Agromyces marinus]UIP57570.1 Putrescine importer PuuP [Agromyces marinus]BDZ54283.1 amino acid transporter [Agromyces marinus]
MSQQQPSPVPLTEATRAVDSREHGLSKKGLSAGSVGLIGAIVIGISCIAPAYTLTGSLGPTVAEVGTQLPAIFLLGFIPMLLVAFGYRELNSAMPDSGTSFTWATRAFGPWVGWMAGWGLIAATVVVLSNLAGIAVEFFYLALAQAFNNPEIANLVGNPFVNVATCLAFIAGATLISYRDMQTTQKLQYWLVGFQLLVMIGFGVAAFWHVANGTAFDATQVELSWFNPLEVGSFSAIVAGLSVSLFVFWGWDVTLTMNEETKGSNSTPGKAATLTVTIVVAIYLFVAMGALAFAGVGTEGVGLGNPEIQENAFFYLAGPILGPLAILMSFAVLSSSAASLQSTFVSPARTLLAMGYYGALPSKFARVSPRFFTPGYATVVSAITAAAFYAIMRFVSEDVLWDTITTLGIMICFYYGITAFAAVWYFRRTWFRSGRNVFFRLVAPLAGGLILTVLFVVTLIDSMDPDYGSGSNIGGLGLVFILGVVILGLGVVVMLWQRFRRPEFFRGAGITRDVAE